MEFIKKDDVINAMENNSILIEIFGVKRKMIDGMMMCYDIADMEIVDVDEEKLRLSGRTGGRNHYE